MEADQRERFDGANCADNARRAVPPDPRSSTAAQLVRLAERTDRLRDEGMDLRNAVDHVVHNGNAMFEHLHQRVNEHEASLNSLSHTVRQIANDFYVAPEGEHTA